MVPSSRHFVQRDAIYPRARGGLRIGTGASSIAWAAANTSRLAVRCAKDIVWECTYASGEIWLACGWTRAEAQRRHASVVSRVAPRYSCTLVNSSLASASARVGFGEVFLNLL